MSLENIKRKLAKIINLFENGGATQGEIDAAIEIATQLMARHNLTRDDLDMSAANPTKKIEYDLTKAFTLSSKYYAWEISLAKFVSQLFGSLRYFLNDERVIFRKNGIAKLDKNGETKHVRMIHFYGQRDDCLAAAEIYTETRDTIQAMGIIRFGGWARGDGAAYCEGFVAGLCAAHENASEKLLIGDEKTRALTIRANENALAIREGASDWLEKTKGFKLRSGHSRSGSLIGSSHARMEGARDGKNHSVSATRRQKITQ